MALNAARNSAFSAFNAATCSAHSAFVTLRHPSRLIPRTVVRYIMPRPCDSDRVYYGRR